MNQNTSTISTDKINYAIHFTRPDRLEIALHMVDAINCFENPATLQRWSLSFTYAMVIDDFSWVCAYFEAAEQKLHKFKPPIWT